MSSDLYTFEIFVCYRVIIAAFLSLPLIIHALCGIAIEIFYKY